MTNVPMATEMGLVSPDIRRKAAPNRTAEPSAPHAKRRHALDRVEAALSRMDQGRYGYCAWCRGAIEIERLQADPTADLCRSCAQNPERPHLKNRKETL